MSTPVPDDAAAQPLQQVAALDGTARSTTATAGLAQRTSPDRADRAASRTTDRDAQTKPDDEALTRADVAWERSLTAAAEAWLQRNPAAPVAPDPDPSAASVATPAETAPTAEPPAADPFDYRADAEAFLDTLPGGDTATIEWGDPAGHLGGVWIPGSQTIILNAARLDGKREQTRDVLRHEIGHVHQNRAMAAAGVSLTDFEARLDALFGDEGIERSADAVALLLGAGSVRYASTFTDAQYDAARAILADRMP